MKLITDQQQQLQHIIDNIDGNYRWLEKKVKEVPGLHNAIMNSWTYDVEPRIFIERCYSFLTGESPICSRGNRQYFEYFTSGYKSCKKRCECAIERRRKTMVERYGHEHSMQSKELMKKAENTFLSKYGVSKLSHINIEKRKETCLTRYNAETPLQSVEILKKIENTCLARYGVKNPLANEKIKQTMHDKWAAINENGQKSFVRTAEHGIQYSLQYADEHFSDPNKILFDPEKLTEQLKIKSRGELARELNCSLALIDKRIKEFNLTEFNNIASYYEILISNLLKNANVEFETGNRKIISPKELDFYIPSNKLAIEFCGLRWHCEKADRGRTYHLNKYLGTKKQGVRLIQIFQDEWDENSAIVKDIILQHLGIVQHRVFGRNTTVKEIPRKEAAKFLNENHLQGVGSGATVSYGLFSKDLLVAAMTFTYKKQEWELKRFAVKIGYKVVGGASKLFLHFVQDHQPKKIFSYCDLRYFTGQVYSVLGFKYGSRTQPGYHYCKGVKRFNRLQFTKAKLIKQGHNPALTEKQIMKDLGYDRIWDCGHDKWIWTN